MMQCYVSTKNIIGDVYGQNKDQTNISKCLSVLSEDAGYTGIFYLIL